MSQVNVQVLAPVTLQFGLHNAGGKAVPNGTPGVQFDAQFAADPGVKYSWRYLTVQESASYGVIVTMLSPGTVVAFLSAGWIDPTTGNLFNKVTAQQVLVGSGNANFQQPTIVVTGG